MMGEVRRKIFGGAPVAFLAAVFVSLSPVFGMAAENGAAADEAAERAAREANEAVIKVRELDAAALEAASRTEETRTIRSQKDAELHAAEDALPELREKARQAFGKAKTAQREAEDAATRAAEFRVAAEEATRRRDQADIPVTAAAQKAREALKARQEAGRKAAAAAGLADEAALNAEKAEIAADPETQALHVKAEALRGDYRRLAQTEQEAQAAVRKADQEAADVLRNAAGVRAAMEAAAARAAAADRDVRDKIHHARLMLDLSTAADRAVQDADAAVRRAGEDLARAESEVEEADIAAIQAASALKAAVADADRKAVEALRTREEAQRLSQAAVIEAPPPPPPPALSAGGEVQAQPGTDGTDETGAPVPAAVPESVDLDSSNHPELAAPEPWRQKYRLEGALSYDHFIPYSTYGSWEGAQASFYHSPLRELTYFVQAGLLIAQSAPSGLFAGGVYMDWRPHLSTFTGLAAGTPGDYTPLARVDQIFNFPFSGAGLAWKPLFGLSFVQAYPRKNAVHQDLMAYPGLGLGWKKWSAEYAPFFNFSFPRVIISLTHHFTLTYDEPDKFTTSLTGVFGKRGYVSVGGFAYQQLVAKRFVEILAQHRHRLGREWGLFGRLDYLNIFGVQQKVGVMAGGFYEF